MTLPALRQQEITITREKLKRSYLSQTTILGILNEIEGWKDYDEEKANVIFDTYKKAIVEIDDDTLKEAIRFRKEHKKQDLSYTDCIGYIYAKRNNLKFLTGDSKFENLPFVEFVKK